MNLVRHTCVQQTVQHLFSPIFDVFILFFPSLSSCWMSDYRYTQLSRCFLPPPALPVAPNFLASWRRRHTSSRTGWNPPPHPSKAHSANINCLAFNPFSEFLLATGSSDTTVALWDMRNMGKPMHLLERHSSEAGDGEVRRRRCCLKDARHTATIVLAVGAKKTYFVVADMPEGCAGCWAKAVFMPDFATSCGRNSRY